MIIKLQISLDADYSLVKYNLESNGIDILNEKLTEHGNWEFTVIADTKAKVLVVTEIYFG